MEAEEGVASRAQVTCCCWDSISRMSALKRLSIAQLWFLVAWIVVTLVAKCVSAKLRARRSSISRLDAFSR